MRRELAGLAAACAAFAASAQLNPSDPDWREAAPPPPPALRTDKLVGVDLSGSALRFGVDPDSVTVGSDRVVRYVVVATSTSGAVNAMYEGIRCDRALYRVYARHTPGAGWTPAQDDWRPIHEVAAARHTLAIARNGACVGNASNMSAAQVLRDLKASPEMRFRTEAR
ncbi:hypothetical protein GCM10027034_24460 [Ramlibacter solisilvae]|uniref:CNP1-like uncharacterized domain-containing protein n=1 Tax=Ramlibacter tataouinensis TaxID=94132 RepID=A0A127JQE5_9BURK|nr:CNP1-like family protein [Ramlibacter tataouinensis]AMO22145.1 hypothetical protein UC35_03650 [Ramlibacter tataouinensis]